MLGELDCRWGWSSSFSLLESTTLGINRRGGKQESFAALCSVTPEATQVCGTASAHSLVLLARCFCSLQSCALHLHSQLSPGSALSPPVGTTQPRRPRDSASFAPEQEPTETQPREKEERPTGMGWGTMTPCRHPGLEASAPVLCAAPEEGEGVGMLPSEQPRTAKNKSRVFSGEKFVLKFDQW